ncbi:MAG TPA: serine/threonine-protein kinase [Polyangiales bacterium]
MEPGRIIADKYRLTGEIGKGGMGSVWSAVHQGLGRTVAVKFLRPQADHDESATARFVSEARMVAAIKHRFVVDVFDFGVTDDGLYYMVLELLDGQSLAERMDRGPAFKVKDAISLIADCLRGLHAVHEAGVVHRDLKPENIFVIRDADGAFPKLIDFGISKKTEPTGALQAPAPGESRNTQLTQPGMIVGTPYYMSPEQLRGRADLDRRADIYGIGVILYELIAGRLPFSQDNIGDLMVAITTQGALPLLALRPELGKALSDVVARALSAKSEDRYATALELRDALLAALPTLPESAMTGTLKPSADGGYGKVTEQLMQAASDPFSGSEAKARRAVTRSKRLPLYVAGAVVIVAALAWLLGTREHAPSESSAGAGASPNTVVVAPPTAASAQAAPELAAPAAPEVAVPKPAAAASAGAATELPPPGAVIPTPSAAQAKPAAAAVPARTRASATAGAGLAPAMQPAAKATPHAGAAPSVKHATQGRPSAPAAQKKIYHTLDF